METILKAVAGVLIAIVFVQVISREGKGLAVLLITAVCCMIVCSSIAYLRPIIDFFRHLQSAGALNIQTMQILLKAAGIGFLSEIISMICNDMGNSSIGKGLQILSGSVILWLALPLFEQLLDLLNSVLGAI